MWGHVVPGNHFFWTPWGEGPPWPNKKCLRTPQNGRRCRENQFCFATESGNIFLASFFCSNPKGWARGWGGGDPLPSGSQQKALTACASKTFFVCIPWGRTTPDGKGSKDNVALDNTQVKSVHRRGNNSKKKARSRSIAQTETKTAFFLKKRSCALIVLPVHLSPNFFLAPRVGVQERVKQSDFLYINFSPKNIIFSSSTFLKRQTDAPQKKIKKAKKQVLKN